MIFSFIGRTLFVLLLVIRLDLSPTYPRKVINIEERREMRIISVPQVTDSQDAFHGMQGVLCAIVWQIDFIFVLSSRMEIRILAFDFVPAM
jgi:hypothetical protein